MSWLLLDVEAEAFPSTSIHYHLEMARLTCNCAKLLLKSSGIMASHIVRLGEALTAFGLKLAGELVD